MSSTSPGYGITIRVEGPPSAQPVAEVTNAIVAAGASITALDVVESHLDRVVIDVTCDAIDADHAEKISEAISQRPHLTVRKVSDRTFLLHLGGKIEIQSKVPLKTRDDLSRAYTPGVARISQAIAKDPSDARRLTIKRNTVAVVTDGSAVLGLGNIGPAAALPVMEGKAALFKRFARVSQQAVWEAIEKIGGEHGWYGSDFLWYLRGLLDRMIGGVGLRRGRRDPDHLHVGESLDFWRVEEIIPGQKLRLYAEMILPGKAWLQFEVSEANGQTRVIQEAIFSPRGLGGQLYWVAVAPFHTLIFPKMLKNIVKEASKY